MSLNALCKVNDIPENGSLGIQCNNLSLFAVRTKGKVLVYQNSCPHLGLPLEWQEHQFLTNDKTLIQCQTHGALFEIESGRCIHGPCVNTSLNKIDIHIENETIFLV